MFLLVLFLFFTACSSPERPAEIRMRHFTLCGRDSGPSIYQAEVPISWEKIAPLSHQNLSDTTIPICSFATGNILITVHNFPYSSLEQRIPPSAQIQRWIAQFQDQDADVTSSAHGGFGGFRLEAYDPQGKGVIAYAMQMTPSLFRAVVNPQIKADYTIKAVGPSEEITREKRAIDAFAGSFELINPIASPL